MVDFLRIEREGERDTHDDWTIDITFHLMSRVAEGTLFQMSGDETFAARVEKKANGESQIVFTR